MTKMYKKKMYYPLNIFMFCVLPLARLLSVSLSMNVMYEIVNESSLCKSAVLNIVPHSDDDDWKWNFMAKLRLR